MRRLFSFAMIALILLNTLGYYGLLFGLQVHNDNALKRQLDNDRYDLSSSVLIKIPLTVPYGTDSQDYQRVDGIFEYKGEFYRMVKQRMYKDTLQIVCVKDEKHRAINQAMDEYAGTLTDKTDDTPSASKAVDFIKEYLFTSISVCEVSTGWSLSAASFPHPKKLISDFLFSIVHPPERA